MTSQRKWGADGFAYRDGPNWQPDRFPDREHVMSMISYTPGREAVECRCGYRGEQSVGPSVNDLWAVHIGKEYKPAAYKKAQLADDSEVHDFLDQIANPWYTSPILRAQSYTPRVNDDERARDAMFAIIDLGQRCTCTGKKPSRECPNFVEGDDK